MIDQESWKEKYLNTIPVFPQFLKGKTLKSFHDKIREKEMQRNETAKTPWKEKQRNYKKTLLKGVVVSFRIKDHTLFSTLTPQLPKKVKMLGSKEKNEDKMKRSQMREPSKVVTPSAWYWGLENAQAPPILTSPWRRVEAVRI